MQDLYLTYLNRPDVEAAALADRHDRAVDGTGPGAPVPDAALAARLPRGRLLGADLVVAVAPMLREVRAMGLTWRDLVSSVTLVAMVLVYWSFVYHSVPLLTSAWAVSAVQLILGSVCAMSAAADLHTRPQPQGGRIARRITTVLGAIALLAGLAGLAANSAHAVEILLVTTVALWFTGTLWHVLSIGGEQQSRGSPGAG